MGSWGAGLYSNDTALDLKSTVAAIVKLPFDTEQLINMAMEVFPEEARQETNEDYTTFWLVLADQFHKRGIDCPDLIQRSLDIIDSSSDLQLQESLGMDAKELKKREKNLQKLKSKLCQTVVEKKRNTLKKPQPLIMAKGDLIVFPVSAEGDSINPYFTETEFQEVNWNQSNWGAAVIMDCGHVFEYLAYYCFIGQMRCLEENSKPDLDRLQNSVGWRFAPAGTCSRTHFQRMQIEILANIKLDEQKCQRRFPVIPNGINAAVNDISISNELHVYAGPWRKDPAQIKSLSEITFE